MVIHILNYTPAKAVIFLHIDTWRRLIWNHHPPDGRLTPKFPNCPFHLSWDRLRNNANLSLEHTQLGKKVQVHLLLLPQQRHKEIKSKFFFKSHLWHWLITLRHSPILAMWLFYMKRVSTPPQLNKGDSGIIWEGEIPSTALPHQPVRCRVPTTGLLVHSDSLQPQHQQLWDSDTPPPTPTKTCSGDTI